MGWFRVCVITIEGDESESLYTHCYHVDLLFSFLFYSNGNCNHCHFKILNNDYLCVCFINLAKNDSVAVVFVVVLICFRIDCAQLNENRFEGGMKREEKEHWILFFNHEYLRKKSICYHDKNCLLSLLAVFRFFFLFIWSLWLGTRLLSYDTLDFSCFPSVSYAHRRITDRRRISNKCMWDS